MTQTARSPYNRRQVPPQYDAGWFALELSTIQRAFAPLGVRTVTASTTATVTDNVILCNPTSAAITVTLPDPTRVQNMIVTIKQILSNANAVTIGATVDGSASPTLGGTNKVKTVISNGTAWYLIGAA